MEKSFIKFTADYLDQLALFGTAEFFSASGLHIPILLIGPCLSKQQNPFHYNRFILIELLPKRRLFPLFFFIQVLPLFGEEKLLFGVLHSLVLACLFMGLHYLEPLIVLDVFRNRAFCLLLFFFFVKLRVVEKSHFQELRNFFCNRLIIVFIRVFLPLFFVSGHILSSCLFVHQSLHLQVHFLFVIFNFNKIHVDLYVWVFVLSFKHEAFLVVVFQDVGILGKAHELFQLKRREIFLLVLHCSF